MKSFKLFAIALFSCFALACSEKISDSVQMKASEMSFGAEGGKTTLSFNATARWTISCDEAWISFDSKDGTAGDMNVMMSVTPNDGFEDRQADVVISVGTSSNVIKVKQDGLSEFTVQIPYTLDAEAQMITIDIKSNVEYRYEISEDAKDWISIPELKSIPTESQLSFAISANSDLVARTGKILVIADNSAYCLLVKQYGVAIEMLSATVAYLANSMYIYDNAYTSVKEYYIYLKGEKQDIALAINSNPESTQDPFSALPEGVYYIDAGANHLKETFSIKQNNEPLYTTIIQNGEELDVIDGEITVNRDGENYTIFAVLIDKTGKQHNFLYSGKIGQIEDKTLGANVSEALYKGQYDTYFASKANSWFLRVYTSKALNESDPYYSFLSTEFFGPAGDVDKTQFPTGTFTFAEPQMIEDSPYANGKMNAQPGTFVMDGYDPNGNTCQVTGGTITITKKDDGSYTVDYDLKVKHIVVVTDPETYEEISRTEKEFAYKATFEKLIFSVTQGSFSQPAPDQDHEFKSVMGNSYSALWLGSNLFGIENTNTFILSFGLVDSAIYNVQLCLNLAGEWQYVKNFRNRFCNTPLPNAVCDFSKVGKANAVYPVLFNGSKYSWIKNSYTGTVLEPSSGSVEVTASGVKFDIDATDGQSTYHFTGIIPSTLQLAQDWSTKAKSFTLP